jgi:defect in organelle trafficking protein DotD
MNKTLLLLLPLSILIAGCSSSPKVVKLDLAYITTDSVPVPSVDRVSQENVAESSNSISHSLQELAAIRQASHPDLRMPKTYNAGQLHMTQRVSINWAGPAEALLQKVAKASHYKLIVMGARPVIPALVTVNKRNKPLAAVFHDIRYQLINKAQILAYPSKNILELRYMKD